jgi:hypothetical protein
VARLPDCLRCRVARLVRRVLYWLNFERTSLSIELISCWRLAYGWTVLGSGRTFCNRLMSSAIGLSDLYLTLFHWKLDRYCSSGSTEC